LGRGEAHLAGSHLLDPESGEYNLADIRRFLPGCAVKVLGLVGRLQGLLVAKGNPKKVRDLLDLRREDINFINRQRGSGTRVLLDYQLRQLKLSPDEIRGYNSEEFTHLAVAVAVASGRADCGMGIAAAAQALELDFIPLYEERYDLVIPNQHYESPLLAPLLELLQDAEYRQVVSALPGYNVKPMGQVVAELGGA
jgi:putative molybdopterin biosynthesis protein